MRFICPRESEKFVWIMLASKRCPYKLYINKKITSKLGKVVSCRCYERGSMHVFRASRR